jgi:hypothetical protein
VGHKRLGPISDSSGMMELYCHERNSELNLLHYGKPINPQDLSQSSIKLIWWKCPINQEHVWDAPPDRIKRQVKLGFTGCPYCHGKRVDKTNSLAENFPEISALWHPTKNGAMLPSEITSQSNKRVWWVCDDGHEWQQAPYPLTGQGTGCPYCAGQMLSDERSLASVAPHLVKEWDEERNGKSVHEVMARTSRPDYWWICSNDSTHRWKASMYNRVSIGSGCQSCAPTGFDPSSPAYYYCMAISGSDEIWWYKGGITADVESRMSKIGSSLANLLIPLDVEVIEKIWFEDGWVAQELETKLLRVKSIRAKTIEKFDGRSELFTMNPVDYARKQKWID